MINRLRRYVGARIARRFFVVFITCAFVPLLVLSALSLVQVRELLSQQGEQRLASTAKSYGMAIFERLLVAGDVALAAGGGTSSAGEAVLESRTFRSLAQVDWDGGTVALRGEANFLPVSPEDRARLEAGKLLLRVTGGSIAPRIELLAPRMPRSAGYVAGELQPEYVWGPADEMPAATDFCIVEERWKTLLYCSGAMAPAALEGQHEWTRDGERFRSSAWTQFMRAAFGSPDWIVTAAQPERVQLAKAAEFARTYVPVMALSLLFVLLLTIRQARDISVPVEKLAARARGVAVHDFAGTSGFARADELGELADSFDQMSRQLGRQFATLKAFSEIDQLILATQDTGEVVRTVLKRLADISKADLLAVLHFDDPDGDDVQRYILRRSDAESGFDRVPMELAERRSLGQDGTDWPRLQSADLPAFVRFAAEQGMASAFVQPVIWRGTACGAIVLGFADGQLPQEQERRTVRDLADRVAVAVSTAWRDRQLYRQSHFDPVTGAPNRLLFRDRLSLEIVRSQREGLMFGLLFVDLDHFKHVNDSYGHSTGDAILREAAGRITHCVRASDTVARLGGDEFTVLLPNLHNGQEAWLISETIVAALSREFVAGEHRCFLSASIGISTFPADGDNEEALLKSADTAMYRAKAAGRAQTVFFETRMNEEAMARVALDRDLRVAIERHELRLVYQPQFSLRTGQMLGAEALVRWRHPVRGDIPPTLFIPLAEDSGFIDSIGQWVVREACRQVRAWDGEGVRIPRVAVNVSPRQFRRRGFDDFLLRATAESQVEPSRLEIEITEGLVMDRGDAAESLLQAIAARGHPIALDDFGTGFSSMSYLHRLPVHLIKIDRAFVVGLERGTEGESIVAAIIAMAHALGKQVVAEGVELREQEEVLERLGCDAIQGFLRSPPVPPEEIAKLLRAAARRAVPA